MASDAGTAAGGIDVEATIRENANARAELMAAVEGLPASVRDEPCSGDWSVGDVVAHLAGAQEGYAEALEHVAVGEPPRIEGWEPGPPDDWNRATVSARREREWQRLVADLDTARLRHAAAVRAVPAVTYAAAEEGFPHQ
ncbi:MAG: DinB family protein [Dehalococcoidia bacterium]